MSTHASAGDLVLPDDAVIIHGLTEERSEIPDSWKSSVAQGIRAVKLVEAENITEFFDSADAATPIFLRRRESLSNFVRPFVGHPIYLDVTGLSHHVWMPLLRHFVEQHFTFNVIYAEPANYTISPNPRPSEFFDLSERIRGVSPIPTFAHVARRVPQEATTVALLGFEGARFKYLLETLQPEGDSVYPIIGIPGFQIDYPFHAYEGNADPLDVSHCWPNVRFADAACPFSLYLLLQDLRGKRGGSPLRVAPIGTKPHAIGAALYAVLNDGAELVYDHPVRKKGRTSGAGACHVYNISEFVGTV